MRRIALGCAEPAAVGAALGLALPQCWWRWTKAVRYTCGWPGSRMLKLSSKV